MAKIKGTNVAAPIVPYTTNDIYPTHEAKYGKGGFMSVADLEALNQIPTSRCEEGMLVYVISDPTKTHLYQFFNQEWVESTIGKSTSLVVDGNEAFRVKEVNGNLIAYNKIPSVVLNRPTELGEYSYIKINSFYYGGQENPDAHSKYNYCSHYYVELANTSDASVSLDGLYLKKTHKKLVGGNIDWDTLALTGEIPAHSTYIIRGPQCAILNNDTTYVKVSEYNQEWDLLKSTAGEDYVDLTLYLCWGYVDDMGKVKIICNGSDKENPENKDDIYNTLSYVDCVGLSADSEGNGSFANDPIISGAGLTVDALSRTVFQRKNPCDPSYIDYKDCKIDWRAYTLVEDYSFNSEINYTNENSEFSDWVKPSASYEGKTKADKNTWFVKDKPTTVTCTVGRRASLSAYVEGEGNDEALGYTASRCFTWTTLGKERSEQFIWVRKKDEEDWNSFASIKDYGTSKYSRQKALNEQDSKMVDISGMITYSRNTCIDAFYDYYKCQVWEAYTGEVIASHRAVLLFSEAGTYEYFCGEGKLVYSDDPLHPDWVVGCNPIEGCVSDIRTFTIQNADEGTLAPIAQVGNTGISNKEDGLLWKITSEKIKDYKSDNFTMLIHSGNIVKDGTRPEEWIDYINNNELAKTTAEFLTLGRDDLGEINLYELGTNKVNPNMIDLFYTFELSYNNPPFIDLPVGGAYSSVTKRVRMPGLYSTRLDQFTTLCSISTPIVTYPGTEESLGRKVSTVFDVFGTFDPVVADFPGGFESDPYCVTSTYYQGIFNWLFFELAISKNKFPDGRPKINDVDAININLFTDDDNFGEGLVKSLNKEEEHQNANDRDKSEHFILLMNRPPISPINTDTFNIRHETDAIRSLDVEYDGINTRINYLLSRIFKCWGIRLIIGSCDQISGLSLPMYDAPVSGGQFSPTYDPQSIAGDWFDTILSDMYSADTFSPVVAISDLTKVSTMIEATSTTPITVFWNGTSAPIQVNGNTYQPYSKNEIDSNEGVLSLELCEDDSDLAPQYSLLQTTTNRFGTEERNNTTVSQDWFEFNLVNSEVSKLCVSGAPTFMIYENFCGTQIPKHNITIECCAINNVLTTPYTTGSFIENLWDVTKYSANPTVGQVFEKTLSLGINQNNG